MIHTYEVLYTFSTFIFESNILFMQGSTFYQIDHAFLNQLKVFEMFTIVNNSFRDQML